MTIARLLKTGAFALALLSSQTAFAQDDDVMKHIVNNPSVNAYQVYGPQTNKVVKDTSVQGGSALQVQITGPVANPYEAAAQMPITGPVHKGDVLVAAVWLKTQRVADGHSGQAVLRLQQSTDPYTGIGQKPLVLTANWELYSFQAVADADYASNGTSLSIQLGFDQQTVLVGPAFILDMGSKTPATQ